MSLKNHTSSKKVLHFKQIRYVFGPQMVYGIFLRVVDRFCGLPDVFYTHLKQVGKTWERLKQSERLCCMSMDYGPWTMHNIYTRTHIQTQEGGYKLIYTNTQHIEEECNVCKYIVMHMVCSCYVVSGLYVVLYTALFIVCMK